MIAPVLNTLTASQAKALTQLAQQLFNNPAVLSEIIANPRQALLNVGIAEDELDDVLAYVNGLQDNIRAEQSSIASFWL